MKVEPFSEVFKDVLVVKGRVFEDDRGYFFEHWHEGIVQKIPSSFKQDNVSFSKKGVLRGLHFQEPWAQGKLVSVLSGSVLDVFVDLRRGSETFGQWRSKVLMPPQSSCHEMLWIPPGFAHGFYAIEDTIFCYKCSEFYHSLVEHTLLWNDPEVGIQWPVAKPIMSEKDKIGKTLSELSCKLGLR